MLLFFVAVLLLSLTAECSTTPLMDLNKKCRKFAAEGHSEVNPRFMMKNCAASHHAWLTQASVPDFYSIVEKNINEEDVGFESLRGKLVYMVNVASEDGHSKDNYYTLKQLSLLRNKHFEIVIFPCNQFGDKEPRSGRDVAFFARMHGYRGIIMSKGDVNGIDTRPAFRFLKANSSKKHINGNFDGHFLMDSDGQLEVLSPGSDVLSIVSTRLAQIADSSKNDL